MLHCYCTGALGALLFRIPEAGNGPAAAGSRAAARVAASSDLKYLLSEKAMARGARLLTYRTLQVRTWWNSQWSLAFAVVTGSATDPYTAECFKESEGFKSGEPYPRELGQSWGLDLNDPKQTLIEQNPKQPRTSHSQNPNQRRLSGVLNKFRKFERKP